MTSRTTEKVIDNCIMLMSTLLKEYCHTYPQLKKRIDGAIKILNPKTLRVLDQTGWRRIHQEDKVKLYGSRRSRDFWNELEEALRFILNDYSGGRTSSETKSRIIRYGVFPCQDTILPLYFEDTYYSNNYEVEFKRYENWDEGLTAFLNTEIDIALHNFETAVAYNSLYPERAPLFFWPFFSFNGYGIFVKNSSLTEFGSQKGKIVNSFKSLSLSEKKEFFLTSKKLVERTTDFEWILKTFCREKLMFNNAEMDLLYNNENIIDCNTNTAKTEFISEDSYAIYCTNPIHIHDLVAQRNKNDGSLLYDLIAHGEGLTTHKNFNGLICHSDICVADMPIIRDIIEKWFLHTGVFLQKISKIAIQNPLKTSIDFTIPALVTFLNRETNSNITAEQLSHVFDEAYNHFYKNEEAGFREFYNETLGNSKLFENYVEITMLALTQHPEITSEIVRGVIKKFTENMSGI